MAFSSTKYDVFLSFRGEDMRNGFTSHLHAALQGRKIVTYMDDKLEKGDEISPALLRAIKESKIFVIVLSENYASSTWCLEELSHIISWKKGNGQDVIPLFYHVSYADALADLEQRFASNIEKVRQWRGALATLASLSGWDTSVTRPEPVLIEKMVEDILKKLRPTTCTTDEYEPGLVGMPKRVKKIKYMLQIGSPNIRIICIWGMPGIGKTTLACSVFDQLSSQFDGCCFVEKIAEKLHTMGQNGLKKEVYSTLLKENTISNLSKLGELGYDDNMLQHSKILIVLDDLKDLEQLRLLAGKGYNRFGVGSLIIVTTKDKQVVKSIIHENQIYEVEGLHYGEALELFKWNAFRKSLPTANCEEMAKEVINYCEGNPLALSILGSYLGGKSERGWRDALEKLKCLPNKDIQNVLKVSYDELDVTQKDIFLDIACFFEGDDRDHVESILDACNFYPRAGIDELINKALVTVVKNKLKMHSLLQEMGQQEVVRQQSKNPEKRSRIWLAKDVYQVLRYNTGTPSIEGIFFNMSDIKREIYLSPNVFQKMHNLRLLKIYNIDPNKKCKMYIPGDLCLPDELRYLHWEAYPLKALPVDFYAEYLVELNMPNSQVKELWNGDQDLPSLRKIDFSNSKNLMEISSLCRATKVEHVLLEHCGNLSQVPPEFKHLDKLKTLNLEGCSSLKVFPELSKSIRSLVLSGTSIEEVPSSIGRLTQLELLYMRDCKKLLRLPTSIFELKLLIILSVTGCAKLETFPKIPENIWSLISLELDKTSIEALSNITLRNIAEVSRLVFEGRTLIPYNNYPRWIEVHNICDCELLPHRHKNISYMFESSPCLSLLQLQCYLLNQRSKLPFQFFFEKDRPKLEIASICRSELLTGLSCGTQAFYELRFYNRFGFRRRINKKDATISSKHKFNAEIERFGKVEICGFQGADAGVCYNPEPTIPEWFPYQFENCSPEGITLNIGKRIADMSGYVVCVVVHFGNHRPQYFYRFRVVFRAYYYYTGIEGSGPATWEFSSDYAEEIFSGFEIPILRHTILKENSSQVFDHFMNKLVFDFYFVDENNQSIEGCSLRKCGIDLIFGEETRKLGDVLKTTHLKG